MKEVDFGEGRHELPLTERKSVSILLGAGFSAHVGYPVGGEMNDRLLHFDYSKYSFSSEGKLVTSTDGTKPMLRNSYESCFVFCKRLIEEYSRDNKFDYEEFYDFIKSDGAKEMRCRSLCGEENFDYYLYNVPHIYNQMVASLLKDRSGRSWYDNESSKMNYDPYGGFLTYLSEMSEKFIINVHTLNHDLLFESFNNLVNGKISDGFDEYGSDY